MSKLKPGPYSIFVLSDNGTWIQPTYIVGTGWSEANLERYAEHDNGGFYTAGLQRDDDVPEGCGIEIGDADGTAIPDGDGGELRIGPDGSETHKL